MVSRDDAIHHAASWAEEAGLRQHAADERPNLKTLRQQAKAAREMATMWADVAFMLPEGDQRPHPDVARQRQAHRIKGCCNGNGGPNCQPPTAAPSRPESCWRCNGRGYIPDFSAGLDPIYGEPGKKPCPECQLPHQRSAE